MFYINQHPIVVLLFFTVPLFGWILYKSFHDNIIWIGLGISLVGLLPCILGYFYIFSIAAPLLLYIAISCGYYFVFKKNENVYTTIVKPTIVLFVIFGFVSFMGGFYGTISVQDEWKVKGYKIEYLKEQGFSGGPLMKYRLYKYADIPIFIRHVCTKVDTGKAKSCVVKFKYKNFSFDSCSFTDRVF